MNFKEDYRIFEELASTCGSRYAAVMYIAKTARKLALRGKRVSDSALVKWAISGEEPKGYDNQYIKRLDDSDILSAYDILSYVDDQEIVDAVLLSYRTSIKKHMLTFADNNLDDIRNTRARILTRMVWYSS